MKSKEVPHQKYVLKNNEDNDLINQEKETLFYEVENVTNRPRDQEKFNDKKEIKIEKDLDKQIKPNQ
jgi:hypothetical protein